MQVEIGAEETSGNADGDGITGVSAASTNVQAAEEDEDKSMELSNGNNEVTHIHIPGGRKEDEKLMEIYNEDFRTDEGGTPDLNFVGMMEAGQRYLDLPVPRKLTPRIRDLDPDSVLDMKAMLPRKKFLEINRKRSEACNILQYLSPPYLSVMANTDIGLGTDPVRSEEHILNKKKQVLVRKIFATCLFKPGLCETVQTVHAITEESQLSNGRKIDFGIAGGFEGVQLGFRAANETLDWSHARRVIAIADLRYQWATTEARIHRDKLYKFLTKDCKDALEKINGWRVDSELSRELSWFIEKYGTHVVLKCTHGYRMEKVERTSVSDMVSLQKFKAGIMASVLGYAGISAEYQKKELEIALRTENSLGIMNIGSKERMKEVVEAGDEGINFERMMFYSGEEGDAGVISHDWNMMIAEMLLAKDSPYKTAAKRLQYWTHVRINDLKAGWEEGLFATSYELKFVQGNKTSDKNVCVMIGGRTVVHHHPGNDTTGSYSCGHITNVHTNEAKKVRISVLDDELALKDVLAEITVFKRVLADDGVEGRVCAMKIDTGCVFESEVEVAISDLPPRCYDFGPIDSRKTDYEESVHGVFKLAAKKQKKKTLFGKLIGEKKGKSKLKIDTNDVTIGKARAKVC